jgi:deferrochelatase/peroxidase EfeB
MSTSAHQDGVPRRRMLAGAAALAACLTVAGCTREPDRQRHTDGTPRRPDVPQQTDAIEQPPPARTVIAAYDVAAGDRSQVASVLRRVAELAAAAPPGTEVITGLGAALFGRAGLEHRRPRQLRAMPTFAGDVLDPTRSHGDVVIQVGGPAAGEVLDGLTAGAAGLRPRWRVDGFRDQPHVEHDRPVSRNLFGFAEGHGNPEPGRLRAVARVPAGAAEPAWAIGGSYQVVRIIAFATALWDRDPVEEQERIIGRRRDGHWLDGTPAHGEPAFATDPADIGTPLESHVRRANPRTGPPPPLLRRGFSFSDSGGAAGRREQGLLFQAFQGDLAAGFEAVQRRLAGEKLGRYVLTVGGGYYFVPPANRDAWWGAGLFGD